MPESGRGWFSDLARFAGLGIQLTIWLVLGVLVGYLGDKWLGTNPWLLIMGALLGAAGGMGNVMRAVSNDPELGSRSPDGGQDPPARDASDRERDEPR